MSHPASRVFQERSRRAALRRTRIVGDTSVFCGIAKHQIVRRSPGTRVGRRLPSRSPCDSRVSAVDPDEDLGFRLSVNTSVTPVFSCCLGGNDHLVGRAAQSPGHGVGHVIPGDDADLHRDIAEALNFPDSHRNTLDALNDGLRGIVGHLVRVRSQRSRPHLGVHRIRRLRRGMPSARPDTSRSPRQAPSPAGLCGAG